MSQTLKGLHNAAQNTGYLINLSIRFFCPSHNSLLSVSAVGAFLMLWFNVFIIATYEIPNLVYSLLAKTLLSICFYYILLGFIEMSVTELSQKINVIDDKRSLAYDIHQDEKPEYKYND